MICEFNKVLEQEESLWFQKSRCAWFQGGDRNTKFFHLSTVVRRRRNKVVLLRNKEGCWIEDKDQLKELAVSYFKKLYSEDLEVSGQCNEPLPNFFSCAFGGSEGACSSTYY